MAHRQQTETRVGVRMTVGEIQLGNQLKCEVRRHHDRHFPTAYVTVQQTILTADL
jgi:hypothetical protein